MHVFVLRVRHGLEELLRRELGGLPGLEAASHAVASAGIVELHGEWPCVYAVARGSRLVERVSVRVGAPFRCEEERSLDRGVREAPWSRYLLPTALGSLPILVRTYQPRFANSQLIEAIIGEALSEEGGASTTSGSGPRSHRESWSSCGLGLEASVRDDECSLELNCSGPLRIRPFVYTRSFAEDGEKEAQKDSGPRWREHRPHATPYRGDAIADGNWRVKGSAPWSLKEVSSSRRFPLTHPATSGAEAWSNRIAAESSTRDLAATAAAALVAHIPLRELLAEATDGGRNGGGGLVVWDPFCGNGTLLMELLGTALGVAPVTAGHPFPCVDLLPDHAETTAAAGLPHPLDRLQHLTLVGSDGSVAAILRARRLLHRFCAYHRASLSQLKPRSHVLDEDKWGGSWPGAPLQPEPAVLCRGPPELKEVDHEEYGSPQPDVQKQYVGGHALVTTRRRSRRRVQVDTRPTVVNVTRDSLQSFSSSREPEWGISLPCEVSLNIATFERVGPYIGGALVVTRAPREVHALGPTHRVAKLYERFGHFLKGRSDWCGAYVLAEGSDFKRHSKLPWEVMLRFKDHMGRKCQLLRWMQPPR